MSPLKILITGANGFVGRHLRQRLEHIRAEVWGLDLQIQDWPRERFFENDITQSFSIQHNFDFVIHCAAYNVTHVGQADERVYEAVNVMGTRHVLKACQTKNLIFLSTTKVYQCEGQPITEDAPVVPQLGYEMSKFKAEAVCQKYFQGQHLTILRSVNIVGSGQPEKSLIPVLFKKAKAQEPLDIFGPASAQLQLLDIRDLGEVVVRIVEKGGLSGIFNVASSDHRSLADIAEMIKTLTHSSSQMILRNLTPVSYSPILSTRLEKALNWKAQQTIPKILEAYAKS